MTKRTLIYRKNKLLYKFIPEIDYYSSTPLEIQPNIVEDIEIIDEDVKEEPIEEKEEQYSEEYRTLLMTFSKMRKNAKRKLEITIRREKDNINELNDDEKKLLLSFIDSKFF